MKFLMFVILLVFLPSIQVSAQVYSIKGTVNNSTGSPIINANAELLRPRDSSVIKGSATKANGEFELNEIRTGFYLIRLSFLGYETYYGKVKVNSIDVTLEKIVLQPSAEIMEGIKAKGYTPPVKQKGDTSEYKAGAYKTNPDANAEDLVGKMPGVTNTNGKVQVQGEDVKTILVDGKPFFGDDPAAVLKNLPADAIDKVQVFDAKSQQSQFTGFDDGNTSKTINIITKAQYKNGVFGKMSGGYGYDDKWRGNASINAFKNERKISFLFNSNNINEQNFSADDLLGVSSATGSGSGGQGPRGGGGGRTSQGGPQNSTDNFLTNTKSGIVTTQAFGLNYTNKWKKVDFTGSYFFNYSNSNATTNIYRTYITRSSEGLLYQENSNTHSKNTNHRANLKIDWKIDSFNSILFQPRFSYQENSTAQNTVGTNTQDSLYVSDLHTNYLTNPQYGFNWSAPVLFRHSFKKRGRTFSINATPGYSQSKVKTKMYSQKQFADTLSNDTINQLSNLSKNGFTMSSNITYSEPISKFAQLLFNYTGNLNFNNSDKQTNQFTPQELAYSTFDSLLSNTFNSRYIAHGAGANYNYKKEKLNFSFGGNYQFAQLSVHRIFPSNYDLSKTFVSFLPTAMFQYRYNQQKNIRLFYRTSNNVPSIDQLQDIINNSNPMQLSTGNPALKQDFQNSVNLRYSTADPKKSTSLFAMISGTATRNYIANSTFIASADTLFNGAYLLPRGSQISKPVNLNGYYSIRTFSNYSFVAKKLKSNININIFGSAVRTPSMINSAINYSHSNNAGLGLTLSSNISKDLDFTISSNSNYNTITNTLQAQSNSNYFNQNTRFKIQAMPWKGLVLQTDISHQFYKGLSESINTNYILWNAGIGYKFLKDKQAEFRLVVFDLLKQNTSITRNTTETYYEDVKTNILQRYFMLNFTYNIKYFKQTKFPEKAK